MAAKLLALPTLLYARMESSQRGESRRFALEGKSEHAHIEEGVNKIRGMGNPMSDAWAAALKVFEDLIDHHADEEEGTGLGCAPDEFDKEQLEAIFQATQNPTEHAAGLTLTLYQSRSGVSVGTAFLD